MNPKPFARAPHDASFTRTAAGELSADAVEIFRAGEVELHEGRLLEAARNFSSVTRLAPNDGAAWLMLSRCLTSMGRSGDAVKAAERAASLLPGDARTILQHGSCCVAVGDCEGAVPILRRAVELDGTDPEALFLLGFSLGTVGQLVEAATHLERAAELAPSNVAVRFELSQTYRRAFQFEKSADWAECALRVCDSFHDAMKLGQSFYAALQFNCALRAFESASRFAANQPVAWEWIGAVCQVLGLFSRAEEAFARALELDPSSVVSVYRQIVGRKISDKEGDLVRNAERLLAEAETSAQSRATLCYALGKAEDDLANYERAISWFDRANEMSFELRGSNRYDAVGTRSSFERIASRFVGTTLGSLGRCSSDSSMPIFIVGMPRSGTTLIEQILSCHSAVAAGSELEFWLAGEARTVLVEDWACSSRKMVSRVVRSYNQQLRECSRGLPRVTDKQPNNFVALGLIAAMFPRCKIILCTRDPAETCFSIYRTPFKNPPDYAFRKADIVAGYRNYRLLADHWLNSIPSNLLTEVSYEALVTQPEATIRNMLGFLELDWQPSCLHPESNSRGVDTPSFWQVRQPIHASSLHRWRRYESWLTEFSGLSE